MKTRDALAPQATGDCLPAAFNQAWRLHKAGKDVRLVHGYVSGQGELTGRRFSHAWVEEAVAFEGYTFWLVHEHSNGHAWTLPREMYYRFGDIYDSPGALFRYTMAEAKRRVLESNHYTFWELPRTEDE